MGGGTICGLDIGCGWCVEMCDIYKDFDTLSSYSETVDKGSI